MIAKDNSSDSEDDSEFEKVYKMTKQELKQQNIDKLVEHIIKMKEKIANEHSSKFECVCGKESNVHKFYGACYNCKRPMCDDYYSEYSGCCIECKDCKTKNCIDCSKKCKFGYCDTEMCNICINKKYPDWDLVGCRFICRGYDDKYKKPTNGIYYHCIFPYCGDTNYFENVCVKHYNDLEKFITENVKMLPNDLIKICLDYFFIKMTKEKWNNIEMVSIREYEFDQIKRLENV